MTRFREWLRQRREVRLKAFDKAVLRARLIEVHVRAATDTARMPWES